MSRRLITTVLGVVGLLIAGAMLLGMNVMGSLLADARSESIAGPGVDVFLLTPFPGPGQRVTLEVTARGGSRAGIERIQVRQGERTLAERQGRGATWGYRITSGKSRGSNSEILELDVPPDLKAGDTLPLRIDVGYVVAMKAGAGRFENASHRDVVRLDVQLHSPAGRRLALAGRTARSLGLLVGWFLLVWGVAYLLARAEDQGGPGARSDEEFAAIGLAMGLVGGGFVGYWFFARPVLDAWSLRGTGWAVALTALWEVLPAAWAVWWTKHRVRLGRYTCAIASGASNPGPEVDPSEPETWLGRDLGYQVRVGDGWLRAARDKARLRLRWTGRRVRVNGLVIEATSAYAAVELVHRLAGRVGRLLVRPAVGPPLDVDPAMSVQDIMSGWTSELLAETEAVLERIRTILPPPR